MLKNKHKSDSIHTITFFYSIYCKMVNYNEVDERRHIEAVKEINEKLQNEELEGKVLTQLLMEQVLRGAYITQNPYGY